LVITSAINGTYTSSAYSTAVAYYTTTTPVISLNLASNTTNTGSGSQTTVVNYGTPTYTTQSGKPCMQSTGTNLYINYGGTLPSSFTVCMWFYKTNTGLSDFFGIGNSTISAAYLNTDCFSSTVCSLSLLSPTPTFTFVNNQWNHLAFVMSNWTTTPSATVYLNGVAPTTSTNLPFSQASALAWTNATTFTIVTNADAGVGSGGRLMSGYIAKFQVYNTALSQSQVSTIYSAG
jgi:hypothetical protein